MQKMRKKLLSAALAAVIAVSAVQVPAWSEESPAEIADGAAAPAEEAVPAEGDFVSEEEAFAAMTKQAENGGLALYVDTKNYTFMVENTKTGQRWWSSFYNTDPGQKVQYLYRDGSYRTDKGKPPRERRRGKYRLSAHFYPYPRKSRRYGQKQRWHDDSSRRFGRSYQL